MDSKMIITLIVFVKMMPDSKIKKGYD